MPYRVTGPRGGAIIKAASLARLRSALPGLAKRFKTVTVTAVAAPVDRRAQVVKWARWGVAHEHDIHYTETAARSGWLTKPAGMLPLSTDCSGFATACYRWSGAPDPNGLDYRQVGYTGTMLDHGRKVANPKPGDLVVYGGGTGHHVAVVVEAGADPLTVSHGQEAGPLLIRVSAEQKYQPAGVTYLAYL